MTHSAPTSRTRRRRGLRATAAATVGISLTAGALLTPMAASASEGAPFLGADGGACDGQSFVVTDLSPSESRITTFDTATGEPGATTSVPAGALDAMGYNPADGQLYAVDRMTGEPDGSHRNGTTPIIRRISADGSVERVDVKGFPPIASTLSDRVEFRLGDFDEDGHYWIADYAEWRGWPATTTLYELAISPGTADGEPTAEVVRTVPVTTSYPSSDFTYVPGTDSFWGVSDSYGWMDGNDAGQLISINREGAVTNHGFVADLPTPGRGSDDRSNGEYWAGITHDDDGDLLAVANGTGEVYRINRTAAVEDGAPLSAVKAAEIGTGTFTYGDAAQCGIGSAHEKLPALQVALHGPVTAASGESTTSTVSVTNTGGTDLAHVPVTVTLAKGVSYDEGSARERQRGRRDVDGPDEGPRDRGPSVDRVLDPGRRVRRPHVLDNGGHRAAPHHRDPGDGRLPDGAGGGGHTAAAGRLPLRGRPAHQLRGDDGHRLHARVLIPPGETPARSGRGQPDRRSARDASCRRNRGSSAMSRTKTT